MADSWYNWYYYNELEINEAKETIDFLLDRVEKIKKDTKLKDKEDKLNKLELSIKSIRYTYSLQDYPPSNNIL